MAGVNRWRVVQRLPMLRTAREAAYTAIVVALLVAFPAIVLNGFLATPVERRAADGSLVLLSINVHQGYQQTALGVDPLEGGDPGDSNVARIYDLIKRSDADVVALQGSNTLPLTSGNIDTVHCALFHRGGAARPANHSRLPVQICRARSPCSATTRRRARATRRLAWRS